MTLLSIYEREANSPGHGGPRRRKKWFRLFTSPGVPMPMPTDLDTALRAHGRVRDTVTPHQVEGVVAIRIMS